MLGKTIWQQEVRDEEKVVAWTDPGGSGPVWRISIYEKQALHTDERCRRTDALTERKRKFCSLERISETADEAAGLDKLKRCVGMQWTEDHGTFSAAVCIVGISWTCR